MSWADWVNYVMAFPGVNAAVICDTDGNLWAKSDKIDPKPEELKALAAGITKKDAGEFQSFNFNGIRFMTIRLEEKEMDARKGSASLTAMSCSKCIIIGADIEAESSSGDQLGVAGGGQKVNLAVADLKKQLCERGY